MMWKTLPETVYPFVDIWWNAIPASRVWRNTVSQFRFPQTADIRNPLPSMAGALLFHNSTSIIVMTIL